MAQNSKDVLFKSKVNTYISEKLSQSDTPPTFSVTDDGNGNYTVGRFNGNVTLTLLNGNYIFTPSRGSAVSILATSVTSIVVDFITLSADASVLNGETVTGSGIVSLTPFATLPNVDLSHVQSAALSLTITGGTSTPTTLDSLSIGSPTAGRIINISQGEVALNTSLAMPSNTAIAVASGSNLTLTQTQANGASISGQYTINTVTDTTSPADIFTDPLDFYDASLWYAADGWGNGGVFVNDWEDSQVSFVDGIMNITLAEVDGNLVSGEYRSNEEYGYGYYEVSMKASTIAGVINGFFTYTGPSEGTPHDEIDVEIKGDDTTKIQVNYWTNGVEHPTTIDLGFDASDGFHTYGFLWEAEKIEWYVDGVKIHSEDGTRGALPTHHGKIITNLWGTTGAGEWSSDYIIANGAATLEVDSIKFADAVTQTFAVTNANGAITFEGTATGDITVSWAGTVGDSEATFSRGGLSATADFASGTGTATSISLASGQILRDSAADLSGVTIGGDGSVYATNLESVLNVDLSSITTASLTATVDTTDSASGSQIVFTGNLGNANLVLSGAGYFYLDAATIVGATASLEFSDSVTLTGTHAQLSGKIAAGTTGTIILIALADDTDTSNFEDAISVTAQATVASAASVDVSENINLTGVDFFYANSGKSITLTAAQLNGITIAGQGSATVLGSEGDQQIFVTTEGTNSIATGLGADTITLGQATGTDTIIITNIDAPDQIVYFELNRDKLDLPSTTVAVDSTLTVFQDITVNSTTIGQTTITNGIATFQAADNTTSVTITSSDALGAALGYLAAAVADGDTVAFTYDLGSGNNGTYIFQGGANDSDIVVDLVGVSVTGEVYNILVADNTPA